MRQVICRLGRACWGHIGFRGSFLLLLTATDLFYGFYLLAGAGVSDSQGAGSLSPGQFAWGVIWIAVGMVIATGAFTRNDKFQYALAMFVKIAWAAEFVKLAVDGFPWAWTRAAYFTTLALLVLLAAAWQEPPPETDSPEPPAPGPVP